MANAKNELRERLNDIDEKLDKIEDYITEISTAFEKLLNMACDMLEEDDGYCDGNCEGCSGCDDIEKLIKDLSEDDDDEVEDDDADEDDDGDEADCGLSITIRADSYDDIQRCLEKIQALQNPLRIAKKVRPHKIEKTK